MPQATHTHNPMKCNKYRDTKISAHIHPHTFYRRLFHLIVLFHWPYNENGKCVAVYFNI